jgi:hypothetical protein
MAFSSRRNGSRKKAGRKKLADLGSATCWQCSFSAVAHRVHTIRLLPVGEKVSRHGTSTDGWNGKRRILGA